MSGAPPQVDSADPWDSTGDASVGLSATIGGGAASTAVLGTGVGGVAGGGDVEPPQATVVRAHVMRRPKVRVMARQETQISDDKQHAIRPGSHLQDGH